VGNHRAHRHDDCIYASSNDTESCSRRATVAIRRSTTKLVGVWRLSTVSFGTVEQDQFEQRFYKAIGTGVVFALTDKSGWIVTAKHVFFDPSKNYHPSGIRIRFGWQESESVFRQLGTQIPLRDAEGKDLWMTLDDDTDLAAIPLQPTMKDQPAALPEWLANNDEIFEGESIIVLGFPGIVGNDYLIRAISRSGKIAWLSPHAPAQSRFLIDSNVYPGNSGGPAIRVPSGFDRLGNFVMGGRASMIGVVVEAPGATTDLRINVPGSRTPLQLHQEIPIGATGVGEPASKVRKLLDLARSRAR
jgi:S1-C subfamily serine protease